MRVRPGAILALPVTFENMGVDSLTLSTTVLLPDGWKTVAPFGRIHLSPNGRDLQLITILVPRRAASRTYDVSVVSGQTGALATPAMATVRVHVEPVRQIDVVGLDAPRFTVAGDTSIFMFEVTNRGNDTARVRFTGWNSRQSATVVKPAAAAIPPLGRMVVSIRSATEANDRMRGPLTSELIVRPSWGTEVRRALSTELIPRSGSADLPRMELPLIATVRGASEGDEQGFQVEVASSGSFREDKQDKFEFLVRTPETQSLSVLGHRDEFKARYEVDEHELYAGDWNFSLSPLTEMGRTAAGFGGRTAWGKFEIGGFGNRTRFGAPVRSQAAGWARYRWTEDVITGLHLLHQSGGQSSDVASLSLLAHPYGRTQLELEGAASSGSGRTGQAWSARWNGALPWMSFDLRTVNASPGFGGYYRDMQFTTFSIVGYATSDLRAELTGNLQRRNLLADTTVANAPRSNFIQVGLGYANIASVAFRSNGVRDTLTRTPYDRREDVVQVRTAQQVGPVSIMAYADLGNSIDLRQGERSPLRRFAGSTQARLTPRLNSGLSLEFLQQQDPTSRTEIDRWSGSLMASYVIGSRTQASMNAYGSSVSGTLPQSVGILDVSIEHVLPNLHRAKLLIRHSSYSGQPSELAMAAEYSVPVALPLATVSSTGIVEGRVVEITGKGVAEVFVTLGPYAVVTDERGAFVFADVRPGTYEFTIDRGSAGLQRITSVPLPLTLNVVGGERLPVMLTLLPSATVNVQIDRYEYGPLTEDGTAPLVKTEMDEDMKLAVEMRQGTSVVRRLSDRQGRVRFVDLAPGKWTMSLETAPGDDRRLDPLMIEIDVPAGGHVDTTARLLPRRRGIRIIQQGGVVPTPAHVLPQEETFGTFLLRPAVNGVTVQISSWGTETRARQERNRVAQRTGKPIAVEQFDVPARGTVYRVIAGPFTSVEEAKLFCRSLGE